MFLVVPACTAQALELMERELERYPASSSAASRGPPPLPLLIISTEAVAFLLSLKENQRPPEGRGVPILARLLDFCGRVETVRVVERDERRSHGP
jgi:hypothetical protein